MRKFQILIFILALVPVGVSAEVNDFYIESFSADYELMREDDDGSQMEVTEEIVAIFPEFDQNHGIFRIIPKTFRGKDLGIEINSVRDENGEPRQYESILSGDEIRLKIGNPDQYVHGKTIYKIKYSVERPILILDDHQELYWNVNGTGWPQRFGSVEAVIHIPLNLENSLLEDMSCYVGSQGSQSQNCSIEKAVGQDEVQILTKSSNLSANQTLTYAIGFEKGTFKEEKVPRIWMILKVVVFVGIFMTVFLWMFRLWYMKGRDPKGKGVIVRQYDPPKKLDSLLSSTVESEKLDPKAISSAIVELAVNGYVRIYEKEEKFLFIKNKDYELELIKDASELTFGLRSIADMLFGDPGNVGKRISIKENKNEFHREYEVLKKRVFEELSIDGYFVNNPIRVKRRYVGFGILFLFAGILLLLFFENLWFVGAPTAISSLIIFLFGFFMPSKTKKGVLIRDHMRGLREYMEQAEKDRIQTLHTPEGSQKIADNESGFEVEIFEKLLPYAIIFGIEKEWGKIFEDMYTEAPEWYRSTGGRSFSSAYLAGSLSDFSNSAGTMLASKSSGGGISGGSAGGGAGGGGGGGW